MAPALGVDKLPFSSPGSPDKFHILVSDLSKILGPSSGLTSEDVDLLELKKLMVEYKSNELDWRRYAFADLSRGYTRNLVDEGNGKSNLLVLVWSPGKSSPIHDHADAHCLMKVLKGTLRESQFEHPETEGVGPKKIKETIYSEGEVTYMSDELGLHRIGNVSDHEIAVSLHREYPLKLKPGVGCRTSLTFTVYTPPNAAREGCNIYDENCGRSSHVSQSNFYSVHGQKTGV